MGGGDVFKLCFNHLRADQPVRRIRTGNVLALQKTRLSTQMYTKISLGTRSNQQTQTAGWLAKSLSQTRLGFTTKLKNSIIKGIFEQLCVEGERLLQVQH